LARTDARLILIITLLTASAAWPLAGQPMTISTTGDVLHVHAPEFSFIDGEVRDRLRDGRALRLDFELTLLSQPDGAAVAKARQSFNVSYDLWEERFAVTRLGTPPRSVSHLTLQGSEAWCLDNMTLPLAEITRLGRSTPFWLRLEYRVPDDAAASDPASDGTFTLRNLIDKLSKKRREAALGRSVQAGPFRL
jgi:hypothetical protein